MSSRFLQTWFEYFTCLKKNKILRFKFMDTKYLYLKMYCFFFKRMMAKSEIVHKSYRVGIPDQNGVTSSSASVILQVQGCEESTIQFKNP